MNLMVNLLRGRPAHNRTRNRFLAQAVVVTVRP